MAGRSDDEFRVFVAGFADPLARLAFLLTAGTEVDATVAAAGALARMRRNWREAQTTGAPEVLAVAALVAKLPHRDRRRDDRALVTPDAMPPDVAGASLHGGSDETDDNARTRMILWELWQSLSPRHRVPLLLDNPSVAAPRLAGTELSAAAGSPRRAGLVAKRAMARLTTKLHAYPSTPRRATLLDEDQLMQLLRDALREHAATAPDQVDLFPVVRHRVRSLRSRSYATTAAVGGLLVAGALTAIHLSNAKTPSASEARLSTPAGTPDPSLLPAAVVDAEAWLRAGGFTASTVVVPLWGGIDVASTRVVVVALEAAGVAHGVAVDWYHDPGQAGSIDPNLYFSAHYRAPPGAPIPLASPYATSSRIGIIAPRDIAKAPLVVNGHTEPQVVLDASGFASLDATSATHGAAQDTLQIDLYDARGRLVHTVEVATPAPE